MSPASRTDPSGLSARVLNNPQEVSARISKSVGTISETADFTNPTLVNRTAHKPDQTGTPAVTLGEFKRKLTHAVLEIPVSPNRQRSVTTALQEWEGRVLAVDHEGFTAALVDVTQDGEQETEEADFDLDDVAAGDRELLEAGAVFRWVIGYRNTGGTRERFSRLVFRRMPAWSKKDIEIIESQAIELASGITWE